ncbi:hypothetical protein Leryth_023466 [Lithospermum erythrorhizon]|nr:hypothetical protein Leryth_023466 [Lithospermum erythrorhizon]
MENCSDKACKGKKQRKGYLRRCKRIDHGIQKNKKLHLKGSTSKKVHDPKDKAVKMQENNRNFICLAARIGPKSLLEFLGFSGDLSGKDY